jgi:hypothetical protein
MMSDRACGSSSVERACCRMPAALIALLNIYTGPWLGVETKHNQDDAYERHWITAVMET